MSDSSSTQCALLDKLPAELRLNIYELVYAADEDKQDTEVDLTTAKPPSNTLILSCRQIYNEASKLYREAYRRFWKDSKFIVNAYEDMGPLKVTADSKELKEEDLGHIEHLGVRIETKSPVHEPPSPRFLFELIYLKQENVWEIFRTVVQGGPRLGPHYVVPQKGERVMWIYGNIGLVNGERALERAAKAAASKERLALKAQMLGIYDTFSEVPPEAEKKARGKRLHRLG